MIQEEKDLKTDHSLHFWERVLTFLLLYQLLWFGVMHGLQEESWSTLWDRVLRCSILFVWLRVGFAKSGSSTWFSGFSHPLGKIALLMAIWSCLGAWWSISPRVVLSEAESQFWMFCYVLVLIDAFKLRSFKEGVMYVWPLILLIGVGYGFYQFWIVFPEMRREVESFGAWGDPILYKRWLTRVNSDEIFGLRFYPNLFGLFCGMGFLTMALSKGTSLRHMILGGACLLGIVMSGSKAALLFSLFIWFSVVAEKFSRGRRKLVWPLFFTLSIALVWMLFPKLQASVDIRLEYWKATWSVFLENPWGVGVGTFNQWYPSHMGPDATEVRLAHNDHLQVLSERGWVGGVLHASFWGSLVLYAFRVKDVQEECDKPSLQRLSKLSWGVHLAYLSFFCVLIGIGPVDFPHVGLFFLLTLGALGYFWVLKNDWNISNSGRKAVLILLLMTATVDFPMEDEMLVAIVLSLLLYSLNEVSLLRDERRRLFSMKLPMAFGLVMLSLVVTWTHQKRVVQLGHLDSLSGEDWETFQVPNLNFLNELSFWKKVDIRLNREPDASKKKVSLRLKSLEFLTREMPGRANHWEQLGKISEDSSTKEQAFLKAASLGPMQPRHAFNLGSFYEEMNNGEMALKWYSVALKRHSYAESRLDSIPDMELHLLHTAEVQKATSFTVP